MGKISAAQLIDKFDLKQLNEEGTDNCIEVSDIKRPGLELAGFFDYFTPERIQILGRTELSFIKELAPELSEKRLDKLFSYDIPCIIITRGLEPPQSLLEASSGSGVPIFSTECSTTNFVSLISGYLEKEFAPEVTKHGVLVEVYGVGLFIRGKSGIGKSESALGLVKKGHRLIADDAVVIRRAMRDTLVGRSPEISKHYMELRGLGIINVQTLFGAGAVREEQSIDFIVELEKWDDETEYDRLGLNEEEHEILGVTLPLVTIPVRPGRNLTMVLEVAAMNYRLKSMGYNAANEFTSKLKDELSQ